MLINVKDFVEGPEPPLTSPADAEHTTDNINNTSETQKKKIEELLFYLFVNRIDCYALQKEKGYLSVKQPLALQVIVLHLSGEITIGTYQILVDKVKWGCCDFDLNTIEDFENAKRLYNHFREICMHPLMEMSGGGEYKCHVWIFSETTAANMQDFLKNTCERIKVHPHEIFPKQISVKENEFGNLVKLPLGINKKTGQRSFFLDSDFKKIEAEEDVIKRLMEYM